MLGCFKKKLKKTKNFITPKYRRWACLKINQLHCGPRITWSRPVTLFFCDVSWRIYPCETLPTNLSLFTGKKRNILWVEGCTVTVFIVPFHWKCVQIKEIQHCCSAANYMSMPSCLWQGQKLTGIRNDSPGDRVKLRQTLLPLISGTNEISSHSSQVQQ